MNIIKTKIRDQIIIGLDPIQDARGEAVQIYEKEAFLKVNINKNFSQDFLTNSIEKKTVRGLHFQTLPHPQAKLVRCQRGAILDISVDLRRSSPTYLQVSATNLKEDDWNLLYLPPGVAHGFITLIDILYEKSIPLMVSSQSRLDSITSSKSLKQLFKRTISRLYELTSKKYLSIRIISPL